jgi:processive 1,2-diacylglycerol beta-glucosyltransferase
VTAGAGHRRAAEALAECLRVRHPSQPVACEDWLARAPGWLRHTYPGTYRQLVQYGPRLWAGAYAALDTPAGYRATQPLRHAWNMATARRWVRWIVQTQPPVAAVTHFFPADVLAALRRQGRWRGRLIVVVTDLHPHRFWLSPGADAIVVANEAAKQTCVQAGCDPERVRVIGIPVGGLFAPPGDRAAVRRALGLDPDRGTVLLAGGGMGVGPIAQVAEGLSRIAGTIPWGLQVIVVCGENAALAERLRRATAGGPIPVHVHGFTNQMAAMMQASDLLVTKPGGLTVMEALAVGVPMVLCGGIPGQEQGNADYLLTHGAAVQAADAAGAVEAVRGLLQDSTRLEALRQRTASLSRPGAADAIVDHVITPLLAEADR